MLNIKINDFLESESSGYTLVEISVVVMIVSLLSGVILVGQDLINAAENRAQVAQFDKYSAGMSTFRNKFNAIPGDIAEPNASGFGFPQRGQYAGQGDGNGYIEGISGNGLNSNYGWAIGAGEASVFFVDLSIAKLIDGNFSAGSINTPPSAVTGSALDAYLPKAKVGKGNYIYVYGKGWWAQPSLDNYLGLSAVSQLGGSVNGCGQCMASSTGITPTQAYYIDKKIDDGFPQTGKVTAVYLNANLTGGGNLPARAAGGGVQGANGTVATAGSSTTCYDNNNVAGAVQAYSISSAPNALNCAISVKIPY